MKEKSQTDVCLPVCVARAGDLPAAIFRASELADIIEVRLDCLEPEEFEAVWPNLAKLIVECRRPLIFTLRPAEQGGHCDLDESARLRFWLSEISGLLKSNGNLADVELDVAEAIAGEQNHPLAPDWNRVICSHHDFEGMPSDLEKIYERMMKTPARILKIAVQANDIADCLPVFNLLKRARREGREIIPIAMGEAGIATRILGPSRGSFLTYGALDQKHTTAPGQVSARDLRDLYRVHKINLDTAITGLMGSPTAHSVSPQMHNTAFETCGLNAVYLPFEVRDAAVFLSRLVHPRTREIDWNLRGLSVTAPHKNAVVEHLDWVEPSALEIGAVNTIVIVDDALHGYNTDALGLLAPLADNIESLKQARVALIGAGGAAHSALWSLQRAGASVTVFARNLERARVLAEKFAPRDEQFEKATYEQLDGARFDGFDVVINATPLGTRGRHENETPALTHQLHGSRLAYDLVYNPRETRFLRAAHGAGCATLGGLQMLVAQAAEQFKLWTGNLAPLDVMNEAATRALEIISHRGAETQS